MKKLVALSGREIATISIVILVYRIKVYCTIVHHLMAKLRCLWIRMNGLTMAPLLFLLLLSLRMHPWFFLVSLKRDLIGKQVLACVPKHFSYFVLSTLLVKFRRVSDDDFMEDKLEWIKFSSFAWTHDNKGVFYASFDKPAEIEAGADKGTEGASNKNQKLYYHVLGTPQSEDKLIYEAPEFPNRMWGAEVSDDGNYLIISVRESCEPKNLVYYANLSSFDGSGSSLDIKELVSEFEDEYNYITNEGTLFYFQTKEEFICIDLESPDKDSWKTLIPKGEDILESVCCFHQNILVTTFIHDVQHVMKLYELATGKFISDVNLPTVRCYSFIC